MKIDRDKIQFGDTGTLKVIFGNSHKHSDMVTVKLDPDSNGAGFFSVPVECVATHTPAPWTPKHGELVRLKKDTIYRLWSVIYVWDTEVWITYNSVNLIVWTGDLEPSSVKE